MIDAIPDVSTILLQPPAFEQQVRKKKSRSNRSNSNAAPQRNNPNSGNVVRVTTPAGVAVFVGLALILNDSDEECTVVAQDYDGTWLCEIQ